MSITTRTLKDAETFTALSHPLRTRILDVLSLDGPATASVLAEKLEQKVGNISHHLKILAQADLIHEQPDLARDRRERWWMITTPQFRWARPEFKEDAGAQQAAIAAEQVLLQQQYERVERSLAETDIDSVWSTAAFNTQSWLRLSPAELQELQADLQQLLVDWKERLKTTNSEGRDTIYFFARAFPSKP